MASDQRSQRPASDRGALDAPPVWVARQPVLDQASAVAGYELFLDTQGAGDRQRLGMSLRALVTIGLDALTGGLPAFVSLSDGDVLDDLVRVLPARRVVLQLPASTDTAVLARCRELRTDGFSIAFRDFTARHISTPLLSVAHFVKVRGGTVMPPPADGTPQPIWIATGIRTELERAAVERDGYTHFQGTWLAEPTVVATQVIPPTALTGLRLLQRLQDPSLSMDDLETLIKADAALCYRLLLAVNSAASPVRSTVRSIREATLLLGRDWVRRWATILTMTSLNRAAHDEVLTTAIVRARCSERLAAEADPDVAAEAFLVGMASLFDVLLRRPMAEVLERLPLTPAVQQALLGGRNRLRAILDAVIAYERGSWEECEAILVAERLEANELPIAYLEALQWARELPRG